MNIKRALVLIWPFIPCWAMSAVIHSAFRNVEELNRIIPSPLWLLLPFLGAIPLAVVAYFALTAYLKGGLIGYAAVAVPAAGFFGFFLAMMGSTATTLIRFLWSIVGSAAVFLITISVAALPAGAAIMRIHNVRNPK